MGLAFTKLFARLFSKKEMRILMVGMFLKQFNIPFCMPGESHVEFVRAGGT